MGTNATPRTAGVAQPRRKTTPARPSAELRSWNKICFHFRAAGNLVVATLRRCVLQALHFNGLNNESLCTWLGVVDASTETIMAISETELTGKDLMEMVHRSRSPSMP